jgi:hypothetical protein
MEVGNSSDVGTEPYVAAQELALAERPVLWCHKCRITWLHEYFSLWMIIEEAAMDLSCHEEDSIVWTRTANERYSA